MAAQPLNTRTRTVFERTCRLVSNQCRSRQLEIADINRLAYLELKALETYTMTTLPRYTAKTHTINTEGFWLCFLPQYR